MAAKRRSDNLRTPLRVNRRNLQQDPINILLLGPTGVGKTTFINAFANYLVYDKLDEAVNGEMQAIIPTSFSHTDADTDRDHRIQIGEEEHGEQNTEVGQSNTQQCRSFVFPIGHRVLRFIDTPGVGDTKGIDQDEKNFQDILDYISNFENLKAVFILLRPNEERLTILFRYCVNELLRHLDQGAKDNIIFVFTNSRSTFFKPGTTNNILQKLLKEHREANNVDIPYSTKEAFFFDSEAFRFLALRKNGIRLDNDQTRSYTDSWNRSIQECTRLIEHVMTRPLHALSYALSLNEAEQLVRKLPRPLAETARLIQENIQLAEEHKKKVLNNPQIVSKGIPQKAMDPKSINPQTVCTNQKCRQTTGEGVNQKVEYKLICHDDCYVRGVEQEKIADELIRECQVMDPTTGSCTRCGCDWSSHMHITYKCDTNLTYEKPTPVRSSTTTNQQTSLSDIDQLITALRGEQAKIQEVYKKMAQFLCVHSLLPINDNYVEYLQYFIQVERGKQTNNAGNTEVTANLQKMIADYTSEMEAFKKIVQEQKAAAKETKTLTPEEVFKLSGELYHLPINGKQIRAQVNSIRMGQEKTTNKREKLIELPARAADSTVMLRLRGIVS